MIPQNKIVFQKISPTTHVMSVYQEGKAVYREQLSTKDFLKHDLVHIGIHLELFGTLFLPQDEKMDMELLAGALHNIYDADFDAKAYLDTVKFYYKGMKKRFPKQVTVEVLKGLRMFVLKYFSDYRGVKPGKTLEIIFKK